VKNGLNPAKPYHQTFHRQIAAPL